jgi:hypothetical protein
MLIEEPQRALWQNSSLDFRFSPLKVRHSILKGTTDGRTTGSRVERVACNRRRTVCTRRINLRFSERIVTRGKTISFACRSIRCLESSLCDHLSSRKRVVCIFKLALKCAIRKHFLPTLRWTIFDRDSSCKKFSDHYNATPSFGSNVCRK